MDPPGDGEHEDPVELLVILEDEDLPLLADPLLDLRFDVGAVQSADQPQRRSLDAGIDFV